jgi:hypothetical protein
MKILLLFVLIFNMPASNFLEGLQNAERQSVFCDNEQKISDWTILCTSEFEIVFTNSQRTSLFHNQYIIDGYLTTNDSHKNKLSNVTISYGKSNNENCETKVIDTTDNKGFFQINIERKRNRFLQFNALGFKGLFIEIPI